MKLCQVGDRSIAQVAKELDLTETALREWVKRAEVDAGKGPPDALTTSEREELQRLRRDNKRLQMEREVPKKGGGLLREGECVRYAFIEAEKATWAMSATNDTTLALRALDNAVRARRVPLGLIHHSDRGAPYASEAYRAALIANGIEAMHEPEGRLLGQRGGRELLRDAASGARGRRVVPDESCRGLFDRRLHRPVLQPRSSAFVCRLCQSD